MPSSTARERFIVTLVQGTWDTGDEHIILWSLMEYACEVEGRMRRDCPSSS
jgi:hypothetical protein